MTDIRGRKQDHIDLARQPSHQMSMDSEFEHVRFEHIALPELDLQSIDMTCTFLGKYCKSPVIIGAMTGGCDEGEAINRHLAEAAEYCMIPMALGSQRAAIELNLPQNARRWAPNAILLGNLGATQLAKGGLELAQSAIEKISANALIIHLNPLQELAQPSGDHNWTGVLRAIEICCLKLDVPVIVKEVGAGIGPTAARSLVDAGVRHIETAGCGGTNWASIELARNPSLREREIMQPFLNWGMRTFDLLPLLSAISGIDEAIDLQLIGSGGIRNGLDVARSIRLGASMVAMAQPFLEPAIRSSEDVIEKINIINEQLRRTMFLTGSANLDVLRQAKLVQRG